MDSVYTSYVFSILVQFTLLVILAYNVNMSVPPELGVLREAFRFEYYVSIIEFAGYLLIGYMLFQKKIGNHISLCGLVYNYQYIISIIILCIFIPFI